MVAGNAIGRWSALHAPVGQQEASQNQRQQAGHRQPSGQGISPQPLDAGDEQSHASGERQPSAQCLNFRRDVMAQGGIHAAASVARVRLR